MGLGMARPVRRMDDASAVDADPSLERRSLAAAAYATAAS